MIVLYLKKEQYVLFETKPYLITLSFQGTGNNDDGFSPSKD